LGDAPAGERLTVPTSERPDNGARLLPDRIQQDSTVAWRL